MLSAQTRKVVDVDRGLFLVRYVSAEDQQSPPTVRFTPDAGFDEDIRFVLHPDEDDVLLRHPGTCLVMLADAGGRVAIDIAPTRSRGSVAAKVTIEALHQEGLPALPQATRRTGRTLPIDSLRILGHLAARGDVTVKADEWLAGPAAPARIEGFRLDWPGKPDDLDIRYAVTTARQQAASRRPVGCGAFVGSRGKALAIVGVGLELSGDGAPAHRLAAEMIFLGAPILRASGPRVSGAGPTGREPLVGLRLTVERLESPSRREPAKAPDMLPPASKRLRIFLNEEHRARVRG